MRPERPFILHAAVADFWEIPPVLEELVGGKDINAMDHTGCTALHVASYDGNLALVKFLLGRGINANICSSIGLPLHLALLEMDISLVQDTLPCTEDQNKLDLLGRNCWQYMRTHALSIRERG